MNARSSIAAVCVGLALTACSTPPPAPVQQAAPTTTTTADVPGADPAAWFDAYSGPMGVMQIGRLQLQGKGREGMAAVKEAAVGWVVAAAASDRAAADGLEKLGPMGSDVRSLHERLIKELRAEAVSFDDRSARLRAQAADDKFPDRYQQIMLGSGGNERIEALFKQTVETPKYTEAFRANKVCQDWQALAKQGGGN
ncbi:hypothetical protein [Lentzea albida]|uniref:DUF4142 domain-containing protein n=1 Tax=Lentzea albida TaxID=65499 RepID=A0A1H9AWL6_9PSEU|nr:hypothetical protein [Lentzea albida]SEP80871.1 hypothetical protein SAMN04488000_101310 [Lentzea albida]